MTAGPVAAVRMRLDRVGFCGIDDSVDLEEIAKLSRSYPWIEWGVLLRPDRQGEPRYASADLLKRLGCLVGARTSGDASNDAATGDATVESRSKKRRGRDLQLAAHLCGEDCLRALRGDVSHIEGLHALIGFQRLQINPTVANQAGGWEPDIAAAGLREVAAALLPLGIELILQVNDETKKLYELLFQDDEHTAPPNFAVLMDPSCGTGVAPTSRPVPLQGVHCGYAGGMGPDTITRQLGELSAACEGYAGTVWIDMESGIRSIDEDGHDIFDLSRVRRVVEAVLAADVLGPTSTL